MAAFLFFPSRTADDDDVVCRFGSRIEGQNGANNDVRRRRVSAAAARTLHHTNNVIIIIVIIRLICYVTCHLHAVTMATPHLYHLSQVLTRQRVRVDGRTAACIPPRRTIRGR